MDEAGRAREGEGEGGEGAREGSSSSVGSGSWVDETESSCHEKGEPGRVKPQAVVQGRWPDVFLASDLRIHHGLDGIARGPRVGKGGASGLGTHTYRKYTAAHAHIHTFTWSLRACSNSALAGRGGCCCCSTAVCGATWAQPTDAAPMLVPSTRTRTGTQAQRRPPAQPRPYGRREPPSSRAVPHPAPICAAAVAIPHKGRRACCLPLTDAMVHLLSVVVVVVGVGYYSSMLLATCYICPPPGQPTSSPPRTGPPWWLHQALPCALP